MVTSLLFMPRIARRTSGPGYRFRKKSNKYSIVRMYTTLGVTSYAQVYDFKVIDPTTIQGMRKAKNFQIQFAAASGATNPRGIVWALVYVPAGYTPNSFQSSGELYEPSQNVIASGLYDLSGPGNSARQFTRLARNLNAGDGVYLLVSAVGTGDNLTLNVDVLITYAITLQ